MVRKNLVAESSLRVLKITGVVKTRWLKITPAIKRLEIISAI